MGFELSDGTLKNYNVGKSSAFAGLDPSEVEYVYLGGYPASQVASEDTIKNLGKQDANSKGVIEYGGSKYLRVDYMQSSTQTATLYYRYSPIKWKVIKSSKNEMTLISDMVIDFNEYNGLTSWLSSTFASTAFSGSEKGIIDGSVTLLSASDITSYTGLNLKTSVTEYATMRKNFGKNRYDVYAVGMWWLKASSSGSKAPYVDGSGTVMSSGTDASNRQGIRPVIKIRIQS